MLEDVADIVGLEAVVDSDLNSAGGCDTEERFEEGGRVGCEDADALVVVFVEVVGEATRAVGEFFIGTAEDLFVGSFVVDGYGLVLSEVCTGSLKHGCVKASTVWTAL